MKLTLWIVGSLIITTGYLNAGNFEKAAEMYELGKIKEAEDLYKISCGAGKHQACASLGYLYFSEKSLKKTGQPALKLLDSACENGVSKACYVAGKIVANGLGVKKDIIMANKYVKDGACKAGDLKACNNLGVAVIRGDDGYKKNVARAIANFKSVCESRNGDGCYNLGATYLQQGKKEDASKYFNAACDLKVDKACNLRI